MTDNEAIKHLKLCMESRIFIPNNDVLEVAIKALEKQVPKKPTESNFQNNMFPQCPICDEILRRNQSFCDGCGQKLDWE